MIEIICRLHKWISLTDGKEIDYIKKHKERSPSDVVRDAGGIAAYPHIRDPENHSLQEINENIYTNPFPLAPPPPPPSSPPPHYLGLALMLFHPSASISQRHQRTMLVLFFQCGNLPSTTYNTFFFSSTETRSHVSPRENNTFASISYSAVGADIFNRRCAV